MKVKTGFYFTGWLMKRFFKALFRFPINLHRKYMEMYQDHISVGFIAWFITSSIGIFVTACIGLAVGDTREDSVNNFSMICFIGWGVSVMYFITCAIIDQYEKFQTERMATWHTLKD
jgi:hypothetical protein